MCETDEPLTNRISWIACRVPDFALHFDYPPRTLAGVAVETTQTDHPHMQVIHVYTPDRMTVYFEVAKMPQVDIRQVYEDVQSRNVQPDAELVIGSASEVSLVDLAGLSFSLQRGTLVRQVVLLQYHSDGYRITYDPRSPLNLDILATLRTAQGDITKRSIRRPS